MVVDRDELGVGLCVICMKLTVVQSVSNNGSRKLVRSSNHSIRCHPRSSSFPSKNLNVVSSKISTDESCKYNFLGSTVSWASAPAFWSLPFSVYA